MVVHEGEDVTGHLRRHFDGIGYVLLRQPNKVLCNLQDRGDGNSRTELAVVNNRASLTPIEANLPDLNKTSFISTKLRYEWRG